MNHKKHISNWFTTSNFRCINLALVTDVVILKDNFVVTGAEVFQQLTDANGQVRIFINPHDAERLFKLLV